VCYRHCNMFQSYKTVLDGGNTLLKENFAIHVELLGIGDNGH
jgi:6-phosphogluconolactonase/glucosamine-6-phosphate isomerase/deaminase